jgi:hypothetical protein
MPKNADKQKKAVEKIRKSVRKAVDKGVSPKIVVATVEDAMANTTDTDADGSDVDVPATPKAARMPSGNKQTDVTFKRGVTAPSAKKALNKKPLKPDSEKPSLKRLPGKRKPPTLTLKRGNANSAAVPSSRRTTKITGLNKQTDVTMKRG